MARKRTSKNIPAKGRLRDIADRLWSTAVIRQWHGQCAVCGKRGTDAHHLIPRSNYRFRYTVENGIALCAWDHLWNPETAPHMNAAGWLAWLGVYQPIIGLWYTTNAPLRFSGTTNAAFFLDAIRSLREYVDPKEFVEIVGKRLAGHLFPSEKSDPNQCPECGKIHADGGIRSGCDMVRGRRGWRQVGVYDG